MSTQPPIRCLLLVPSEDGPQTQDTLRRPAQWRGRAYRCAFAAVVCAGTTASVGFSAGPKRITLPDAEAVAAVATHWQAVEVEIAKQGAPMWSEPTDSFVRLDETKVARVGVPLAGRVNRVYVELGFEVKLGQPLFSVCSADLSTLHAERRKAHLELEAAQIRVERVSALAAEHALPERDARAAEQQMKLARLSLKAAEFRHASLNLTSVSDGEFVVRAPRDGRIIEKHVIPAQQLSARSPAPLMTLGDLSSVWLTADLFEADAMGVAERTPARVTLPIQPGQELSGEVSSISAVVDREHRTVAVRVRLDNAEGRLKINMLARVRFLISPASSTTSIAARAVASDGFRHYVYVRSVGGEYTRRSVSPGSVIAGRVLIAEGIEPGDEVVVSGIRLLDNRVEEAPVPSL